AVIPVVRIIVAGGAQRRIVVHGKIGPTALVELRAVRAGYAQEVQTQLLAQTRRFQLRVRAQPAVIGVHYETRAEGVRAADGQTVRLAVALTRIATRGRDLRAPQLTERLRIDHVKVEEAEAREHRQLPAGVPIQLGVRSFAVEDVASVGVVVV